MKINPSNADETEFRGGRRSVGAGEPGRCRSVGASKLTQVGKRLPQWFCAALFASFALASSAEACTACMGDANSNFGEAANGAIFLMLGVLAIVFSLLGAFGFYLYRRALAPLPPHVEFSDGLNAQAEPGTS